MPVPVIPGWVEILIDRSVIVIFANDHVSITLVIGFHEIKPLVVGWFHRGQLGVTPGKPKHGHDQPDWK